MSKDIKKKKTLTRINFSKNKNQIKKNNIL